MSTFQTSFHINGFWHHLTFDATGKRAKDQHGRLFLRKGNTVTSEDGFISAEIKKPSLLISSKDLFMYQRETERAYYWNRYLKNAC